MQIVYFKYKRILKQMRTIWELCFLSCVDGTGSRSFNTVFFTENNIVLLAGIDVCNAIQHVYYKLFVYACQKNMVVLNTRRGFMNEHKCHHYFTSVFCCCFLRQHISIRTLLPVTYSLLKTCEIRWLNRNHMTQIDTWLITHESWASIDIYCCKEYVFVRVLHVFLVRARVASNLLSMWRRWAIRHVYPQWFSRSWFIKSFHYFRSSALLEAL